MGRRLVIACFVNEVLRFRGEVVPTANQAHVSGLWLQPMKMKSIGTVDEDGFGGGETACWNTDAEHRAALVRSTDAERRATLAGSADAERRATLGESHLRYPSFVSAWRSSLRARFSREPTVPSGIPNDSAMSR